MGCPEERLVAFLAGALDEREEHAFDEHLLGCESCWRAIQEDRFGAAAIERLRDVAPAGLADRIAFAIDLASATSSPNRRRRRSRVRIAAFAGAAVAAVGVGAGLVVSGGASAPGDPPQVAAVMAMAAGKLPPVGAWEAVRAGGQALEVRTFMVHHVATVVATSMRPFPMPATSHVLPGSSHGAWIASSGPWSAYSVNKAPGALSVLVVAAMPAAQLPQVAARLHLI